MRWICAWFVKMVHGFVGWWIVHSLTAIVASIENSQTDESSEGFFLYNDDTYLDTNLCWRVAIWCLLLRILMVLFMVFCYYHMKRWNNNSTDTWIHHGIFTLPLSPFTFIFNFHRLIRSFRINFKPCVDTQSHNPNDTSIAYTHSVCVCSVETSHMCYINI